jgi:uncharacterized protein (TIGR03435 family)
MLGYKTSCYLPTIAVATLAGCIITSTTGLAQSKEEVPKPLVFDAATIKPAAPPSGVQPDHGGPGTDSPTLYFQYNASIQDLIRRAWNIKPFQIASTIPIDRDRFDVVARLPADSSREEFRAMFQNLLMDRFALKTHMGTGDVLVNEMLVSDKGMKVKENPEANSTDSPKTKPSSGTPEWRTLQPGIPGVVQQESIKGNCLVFHMQVQQQTLADFVRWLHSDLPMIDHTGMTGKYTFTFDYANDLPGATANEPCDAPGLEEALRSQVGIALVRRKLPFPVVVVDSVNRNPSDN